MFSFSPGIVDLLLERKESGGFPIVRFEWSEALVEEPVDGFV